MIELYWSPQIIFSQNEKASMTSTSKRRVKSSRETSMNIAIWLEKQEWWINALYLSIFWMDVGNWMFDVWMQNQEKFYKFYRKIKNKKYGFSMIFDQINQNHISLS